LPARFVVGSERYTPLRHPGTTRVGGRALDRLSAPFFDDCEHRVPDHGGILDHGNIGRQSPVFWRALVNRWQNNPVAERRDKRSAAGGQKFSFDPATLDDGIVLADSARLTMSISEAFSRHPESRHRMAPGHKAIHLMGGCPNPPSLSFSDET